MLNYNIWIKSLFRFYFRNCDDENMNIHKQF